MNQIRLQLIISFFFIRLCSCSTISFYVPENSKDQKVEGESITARITIVKDPALNQNLLKICIKPIDTNLVVQNITLKTKNTSNFNNFQFNSLTTCYLAKGELINEIINSREDLLISIQYEINNVSRTEKWILNKKKKYYLGINSVC